jgi:hypothetical protein
LKARLPVNIAAAVYLGILKLAAGEGEDLVERALQALFDRLQQISCQAVEAEAVRLREGPRAADKVRVAEIDLGAYDGLLETREVPDAVGL